MGNAFDDSSAQRIAESVLYTEEVQRTQRGAPPLLPSQGPVGGGGVDTAVIMQVIGPDSKALMIWGVVESDDEALTDLWGPETSHRPAFTWQGLRGRHYESEDQSLAYDGPTPVPGAPVPASANILPVEKIRGLDRVQQVFRMSLPPRDADSQISDCNPLGPLEP